MHKYVIILLGKAIIGVFSDNSKSKQSHNIWDVIDWVFTPVGCLI